ncbi:MAG: hypothetical protein QOF19_767 [Alphaproteobacteria bacterium]|nr:hypothetical protein [Alphaproteobacteria bacterium]
MHVETVGQTNHSAGYGRPIAERASRPLQSISVSDIAIPALWSGIGLMCSAPFVPLLSNAMVAEDTFGFLVGLLG